MNFDMQTKLLLFDRMISPILTYGSEVWGIYNYNEIDKLHHKFCKIILGVKTQTSNSAVLGELGRYPLSVICKERAIKYWLRINSNDRDSIMSRIYRDQHQILSNIPSNINTTATNSNKSKLWAYKIKYTLDRLGLTFGKMFPGITL